MRAILAMFMGTFLDNRNIRLVAALLWPRGQSVSVSIIRVGPIQNRPYHSGSVPLVSYYLFIYFRLFKNKK